MPVVKTDRPANKSIILHGCKTKMVTGLQNELDGVLVVSIEQAVAAPSASDAAPNWNKSMKKAELLAVAQELGLDVKAKMTKAQIIEALESA